MSTNIAMEGLRRISGCGVSLDHRCMLRQFEYHIFGLIWTDIGKVLHANRSNGTVESTLRRQANCR